MASKYNTRGREQLVDFLLNNTDRQLTAEEITSALKFARLELLGVWSDFSFSAPDERTERWYFAARAKK